MPGRVRLGKAQQSTQDTLQNQHRAVGGGSIPWAHCGGMSMSYIHFASLKKYTPGVDGSLFAFTLCLIVGPTWPIQSTRKPKTNRNKQFVSWRCLIEAKPHWISFALLTLVSMTPEVPSKLLKMWNQKRKKETEEMCWSCQKFLCGLLELVWGKSCLVQR